MFRKRKFYQKKWFYIIVVLAVFVTGVITVTSLLNNKSDEKYANNDVVAQNNTAYDNNSNANTDDEDSASNPLDQTDYPCYMVKEIDGVVKVFYYNENGEASLYKTTDIHFDLINESDQEMFKEGVIIQNEDELMMLLQDFES